MLSSIQTQLMQVQSLLGFDADVPNPLASPPRDTPRAPAATEYMSDKEEEQLEADLEAIRQDGAREADIIANAWKRQQAEFHDAGIGVAF